MKGAVLRDCKFKVVCETERLNIPLPPPPPPPLTRCCCSQSHAQTCQLNTAPVVFLFFPPERLTAFQRPFHLEIDLASTALPLDSIGLLEHLSCVVVFYTPGYVRCMTDR